MGFSEGFMITSIVLTTGYLVLIIFFTRGLVLILRQSETHAGPHSAKVSVIIPVRNEAETIHRCLSGLIDQDYPGNLLEILVTDDCSDDHTGDFVRMFIKQHPDFRVSFLSPPVNSLSEAGKKKALSRAIQAATGEIILSTDADTSHEKTWITAMAGLFVSRRPQMVLGPVAFRDEGNFLQRIQSLEFMGLMGITAGAVGIGRPLMCNGANLAFRKEAFLQAGGFTGNYQFASGDDMFLLSKFLKTFGKESVVFSGSRQAITYTTAEKTLGGFINQRIRWISKSRGYSDPWLIAVSVYTWLIHFVLLGGAVAGLWYPPLLISSLVLWMIKILFEYPVVSKMAGFFTKRDLLEYYFMAQLFQWIYVPLLGVAGNFLSYRWKGRIIKR